MGGGGAMPRVIQQEDWLLRGEICTCRAIFGRTHVTNTWNRCIESRGSLHTCVSRVNLAGSVERQDVSLSICHRAENAHHLPNRE